MTKPGKGRAKRNKFKIGNLHALKRKFTEEHEDNEDYSPPAPKIYRRLPKKMSKKAPHLSGTLRTLPVSHPITQKDITEGPPEGNRVLSLKKVSELMEMVVIEHPRGCEKPEISFHDELQQGLGISLKVKTR